MALRRFACSAGHALGEDLKNAQVRYLSTFSNMQKLGMSACRHLVNIITDYISIEACTLLKKRIFKMIQICIKDLLEYCCSCGSETA